MRQGVRLASPGLCKIDCPRKAWFDLRIMGMTAAALPRSRWWNGGHCLDGEETFFLLSVVSGQLLGCLRIRSASPRLTSGALGDSRLTLVNCHLKPVGSTAGRPCDVGCRKESPMEARIWSRHNRMVLRNNTSHFWLGGTGLPAGPAGRVRSTIRRRGR